MLWVAVGCGGGNMSTTHIPFCSGCQFVISTTTSGQILTFPMSSAGGLGTPMSTPGPANSTGIVTVWPAGTALQFYSYVSDPQNNAIRVYKVSAVDGSIATASVGPYPLGNANGAPGEIVLFGSTLYVASSAGRVFAFDVGQDGSLTSVANSPFAAGTGLTHLAVISSASVANTNFLYAANTGDANGSISAFTIGSNGALTPVHGSPFATVSGGGPSGFYDGGNILYVALKNANSVAAFTIGNDGSLSALAGSPFPAGHGTSSLAGADGFLFATNNLDGTISSYSMDPVSGFLTAVNGSPFQASMASGDMVYSNGKMFVPDASANSIGGFQPDLSAGTVSALNGSPYQAGTGPVALTVLQFPAYDPPAAN